MSLENQDIPKDNYEVICINDGSPDNCREIVIRLQREFKNIILIDKKNQGVSCARNDGIEISKGRYILFIDPDDYVDPNSFGSILSHAETTNAQVSFLGFTFLNKDGSIRKKVFNESFAYGKYTGLDTYYLSRGDGRTDPDRMWAVLFDSEFFKSHNFRYLPGVPFLEDGELISRILCVAERCTFYGQSFYQRTTRPGSATNSQLFKSEKSTLGFISAARNLKIFQKKQQLSKKQKVFLNQPICKFTILALRSALKKPYFLNYMKIKRILAQSGLKRLEPDGVVSPYKLWAYLYNNLPFVYLINALLTGLKNVMKEALLKSSILQHQPEN
jgi:glycosyltransferase involved in cell wall biosynthesis